MRKSVIIKDLEAQLKNLEEEITNLREEQRMISSTCASLFESVSDGKNYTFLKVKTICGYRLFVYYSYKGTIKEKVLIDWKEGITTNVIKNTDNVIIIQLTTSGCLSHEYTFIINKETNERWVA